MKSRVSIIIARILVLIGATGLALLSLIFLFMDGRLLFSGDWLVYSNPAAGFFEYFFKVLINAYLIYYCVMAYITFIRKTPTLAKMFSVISICFTAIIILKALNILLHKSAGYAFYIDLATIAFIFFAMAGYFIAIIVSNSAKRRIETE